MNREQIFKSIINMKYDLQSIASFVQNENEINIENINEQFDFFIEKLNDIREEILKK